MSTLGAHGGQQYTERDIYTIECDRSTQVGVEPVNDRILKQ